MRYIFVHGLGQNASSWAKTISWMEIEVPISHPDLFELLKGKEPTYTNLYLAFSEYMETFSEPVVLTGLSLGAVLALNYTIDHPQRVQSLVLIAGQYKPPKSLLKIQNTVFRLLPEFSFQKLGMSKKGFLQLLNSMMMIDFSNDLNKVYCQTLVLYGSKDKANKRAAEKLAEKIPNSEIRMVNDAGHEVNIEAPENLASILNDFLRKHG